VEHEGINLNPMHLLQANIGRARTIPNFSPTCISPLVASWLVPDFKTSAPAKISKGQNSGMIEKKELERTCERNKIAKRIFILFDLISKVLKCLVPAVFSITNIEPEPLAEVSG
jgi:hypothetical protein